MARLSSYEDLHHQFQVFDVHNADDDHSNNRKHDDDDHNHNSCSDNDDASLHAGEMMSPSSSTCTDDGAAATSRPSSSTTLDTGSLNASAPIAEQEQQLQRQQRQSRSGKKKRYRSHSARGARSREHKLSMPLSPFVTEVESRLLNASDTPFESPPTVRQVSIQLVKSINTRFQFEVSNSNRTRNAEDSGTGSGNGSGSIVSGTKSQDVKSEAPSISKKTVRSICHPLSNVELRWENPPKNVLIMKHPFVTDSNRDIALMIHYLTREKACVVYMEKITCENMLQFDPSLQIDTFSDDEKKSLHNIIDLVLISGGDGTLLHTAHQFSTAVPPILSFHTGSLGMLTSFAQLPDFRTVLDRIFATKRIFVSIRMRLSCRIIRKVTPEDANTASADNATEAEKSKRSHVDPTNASPPSDILRYQVLNEVVVDRGVSPFLTSLEMYCNDNMVTTVAADGLIVASPTGSTAYSMSAGGSMVHSDVPCILVTPVCPHSLSFRPIILPDTVVLKIKVSEKSRATAWVSIDGKFRQELMKGDAVEIATSVWPVPLICGENPTRDWFRALSTLLHWNTRKTQQKELPQMSPEDWS